MHWQLGLHGIEIIYIGAAYMDDLRQRGELEAQTTVPV